MDRNEDELSTRIERLRRELLEAARHRSLSDDRVIELSQRLDTVVLLAQKKKLERTGGGHS